MPVCDVGTAAVPLALSITNLHKSFSKLEALKGVYLKAKQGDVIAIDGEELRLKCARPDLQPAEKKQIQRLRSRLGMVFQNFNS